MTLYGRVASGYRPGGPNPGAGFGFPATYSSDTTINYEIGYKASLLDRMLSLEASIYQIDWKDIQLQQVDPSTGPAAVEARFRDRVRESCSRSEEHTSELQSLMRISYAVFCLKKKN